jgi:hypothetical protein
MRSNADKRTVGHELGANRLRTSNRRAAGTSIRHRRPRYSLLEDVDREHHHYDPRDEDQQDRQMRLTHPGSIIAHAAGEPIFATI